MLLASMQRVCLRRPSRMYRPAPCSPSWSLNVLGHLARHFQHSPSLSREIKRRRPQFELGIRTLDPHRLRPEDIAELRGVDCHAWDRHDFDRRREPTELGSLWKRRPGDLRIVGLWYCSKTIKTTASGEYVYQHIPFPPDTRGWLYYVRPHRTASAIGGAVRFRILSKTEANNFDSGEDLRLPNGIPFGVPLLYIASAPRFAVLRDILLRDKLVSPELMQRCAAIGAEQGLKRYRKSSLQIISSFEDTFVLDLAEPLVSLWFCVDEELHKMPRIKVPFEDNRIGRVPLHPYTGKCICRFEPFDLEGYSSGHVLVLRCVKILEPVQCVSPGYDGYLQAPAEGSLLHRNQHPLSFNITSDPSKVDVLRRLYEYNRSSS